MLVVLPAIVGLPLLERIRACEAVHQIIPSMRSQYFFGRLVNTRAMMTSIVSYTLPKFHDPEHKQKYVHGNAEM